MKKNILLILIVSSLGLAAQSILRNSVTTNSEIPMVAFIDSRVVAPTNGITAGVATNIAAYQAQIATNSLYTNGTGAIGVISGRSIGTNTANFRAATAMYLDTAKMTATAGGKFIAENGFQGDGSSIHTLQGSNMVALTISNGAIANATINSNKLDAATLALLGTGSGSDPNALTNGNVTPVLFYEPFSLHFPGGGSVDWKFDILSGGGHSLQLSQTGGVIYTFSDGGALSADSFTASGSGFSGNGSGLSNLPPAALQLTAASLVGRSSAGVAQEITVGTGLSLSGTALTATASGSATNAVSTVSTNGVSVGTGGAITNLDFWAGTGVTITATNRGSAHVDVTINSTGGSQTPWVSQIDADTNGIIDLPHLSGVAGFGLHLEGNWAADARITLYSDDDALPIWYESTYGHHFVGPVNFANAATFDSVTATTGNYQTAVFTNAVFDGLTNALAQLDSTGALTTNSVGANLVLGTGAAATFADMNRLAVSAGGYIITNGDSALSATTAYWFSNAVAASSVSNAYNVKIAGNLDVTGAANYDTLNVTNFNITTNWNGSLATNLNAANIAAGGTLPALNAASVTNYNTTNIVLNPAVLTTSGTVTNFLIQLLPGIPAAPVTIYTLNTNVYFTFTGTNANWSRTVFLNGFTNTVETKIAWANTSTIRTNFNFDSVQTNGFGKIINFYSLDGTNIMATDGGRWR
jgi:hypothetical protein